MIVDHTRIREECCYPNTTIPFKVADLWRIGVPEEQEFDRSKYRDNPEAMASYLNEAIARRNDLGVIVRAIGNIMRAQNVVALSEETGLRRENLYRMFTGLRDPRLGNTIKVLESLGLQLAVKPRETAKIKMPRAKLGRPPSAARKR